MAIESLIHEPGIVNTASQCVEKSRQHGYKMVDATDLVSEFWRTTFTPSSSETIFRSIWSGEPLVPISSCLPCIRITDLPLIDDGWHLLHFHMHTFVRFEPVGFLDHFRDLLDWLATLLGTSKNSFYYIASTIKNGPQSFVGLNLSCRELEQWGISADHILPCSGLAAYQDAALQTARNGCVRMIGPKVEVLYPAGNGRLLEIATFEIADTYSPGKPPVPVSAFVIGIERVAALIEGTDDIRRLPVHNTIITSIAAAFLDERFVTRGPGHNLLASATLIAVALFHANKYFDTDRPIGNRGVGGHYKKMLRELLRILGLSGVPPNDFLLSLQIHLDIDASILERLLYEVNS